MTAITNPLSLTSTMTATYDAWNRLVHVAAGSQADTTMEYDGLGQRISRRVLVDSTVFPAVYWTYHYYYDDQWQLLTQTKVVDSTETVDAIYHWHPHYIDALATRMRASDIHHFLHDANFNVTAAVDDSTDAVVERYQYTPYGEVTFLEDDFDVASSQSSTIGNQHLYTGRERDPETGLQLNRHRYYASHLGHWISRDIAYLDSFSLYEYVASLPLIYVDPSGRNIYLKRGNNTWNPINNLVHQNICVDEHNDCGATGTLACFSFGWNRPTFRRYPARYSWLGWSMWFPVGAGPSMVGMIYEADDVGTVVDTKITTPDQDRKWLSWMRRVRVGTEDVYTPLYLNCRLYTKSEFADAPGNH